jgi:hypothetical protein
MHRQSDAKVLRVFVMDGITRDVVSINEAARFGSVRTGTFLRSVPTCLQATINIQA